MSSNSSKVSNIHLASWSRIHASDGVTRLAMVVKQANPQYKRQQEKKTATNDEDKCVKRSLQQRQLALLKYEGKQQTKGHPLHQRGTKQCLTRRTMNASTVATWDIGPETAPRKEEEGVAGDSHGAEAGADMGTPISIKITAGLT